MAEHSTVTEDVIAAAAELAERCDALSFGAPVSHVYNPLRYAWGMHEAYLRRFVTGPRRVVFLGMNPGPFGMAQTGVPFGEIAAVRDWMGLSAPVGRPEPEHHKRPVQGLGCTRSEVSGRRLWGAFAERFGTADAFFAEHFVGNYCPLVFMQESGRNHTPDKLPADERAALDAACDVHLRRLLAALQAEIAVGVGAFAVACLQRVLGDAGRPRIAKVLHPSPASPAANRGWAAAAGKQLVEQGVWTEAHASPP